jgi:hypothetical protein
MTGIFDQQYYKQMERLAMGTPTSTILAEVYIQHMEQKQLYPILKKEQIIGYFRYKDNSLIIYNQNKPNKILTEFNKQNTSITFTIKKEQHNFINFLHLTITLKENCCPAPMQDSSFLTHNFNT